jgi:hypothetical protein
MEPEPKIIASLQRQAFIYIFYYIIYITLREYAKGGGGVSEKEQNPRTAHRMK